MDGGPIGFHLAWHEARGGHDWDGDDALPVAWEMAQQKCQGAKEQVSHAGRSRRGCEAVFNAHSLRLIIPAMRINCKIGVWGSSDAVDAVRFVDLR